MGLGIFCIDHLKCWLTAWSGVFGVWQEGRICGEVDLGISFFDATEEGVHSLSPLQVSSGVGFR